MPAVGTASVLGLAQNGKAEGKARLREGVEPREGEALIVVDVQNDFCPGGALEVPEGDQVLPLVNSLVERYGKNVIYTQDWHPKGHKSFASSHEGKNPLETIDLPYGAQTLWPDHCVQGSGGAAFHSDLDVRADATVVRKGDNPAVDSYSAFTENDKNTKTGLADIVAQQGYTAVTVVGLAFDFCVRWTAEDAAALPGVKSVRIFRDATRSVGLPGSVDAAEKALAAAGVAVENCAAQ